jgi:hypothetical protein
MSNNTRTTRQAWAGAKSFHLWTSETGYCERSVSVLRTHALSGHRGDKSLAPEPEQKRMPTRSFETAGIMRAKQQSQSRRDRHASDRDRRSGGARRDRTDDLLLAKQALSQLSYGPFSDQ